MDNKKKLILFTIVLTCLLSCSEDLTEYYTRLDQREIANKSQEQANSKQEQQNVNQQNKNQQLRLEGEPNRVGTISCDSSRPEDAVCLFFQGGESWPKWECEM